MHIEVSKYSQRDIIECIHLLAIAFKKTQVKHNVY